MILRQGFSMSLLVDKSLTVSAPWWTVVCSFSNRSPTFLFAALLPISALIFQFAVISMPMVQRASGVGNVGRNHHASDAEFFTGGFNRQVFAICTEL